MKEIKIFTDYITLGQFLKFIGVVSTGGEIKAFLTKNVVFVNENMENRRGKKLFPGDSVVVLGQKYIIKAEC